MKLVKGIKDIEIAADNSYYPREVINSELIKKTLRGE